MKNVHPKVLLPQDTDPKIFNWLEFEQGKAAKAFIWEADAIKYSAFLLENELKTINWLSKIQ